MKLLVRSTLAASLLANLPGLAAAQTAQPEAPKPLVHLRGDMWARILGEGSDLKLAPGPNAPWPPGC